ncbi:MAG: capsule assembly Wzi family protein [Treponema sp.]|jgi:hypothetical protein|nr:capsule assembly Wzi family protein [Treponema sp.]
MKKTIAFLSCMLFSVSAFSFDMILTGDPVLEDIRFLSLVTGTSFLSFTPPLAPAELRRFLDAINEDELSQSAMQAYNRARARLAPVSRISFTDDNFSVRLNVDTTLEGEARFNSEVSWYPRYQQITPLISAPLTGSFMDTVQLYFEPIFAKGRRDELHDYFRASIPSGFGHGQFNTEMSVRAFAAAGGNWWNFQIGRDRLFWGTGRTGSMVFADNSPYFDFARISFFSQNVKYSVIVNQMPLRLSRHLFPNDWDQWWHDNTVPDDAIIDPQRVLLQRYFYLQRLDVRLFNRLSIGIMEGIMVGDSPLEIRYLNPLLFFHSLYAWNDFPLWMPDSGHMVGSFFSIEVNWNIVRNWAVHGQFVMNELSLPGETDGHPSAFGWMLGAQFSHSFDNWAGIFFIEIIRTDPFLGILSSPYASFIQMDRIDYATGIGRIGNYYSIGTPRDMFTITAGTDFFNGNGLSFSGSLSWIASGENNINNSVIWNWGSGYPYSAQRSPSGTVEHNFVLSLGSTWRPHSWLSLSAGITGIVALNNNHISGNTQMGGQLALSAGFRI